MGLYQIIHASIQGDACDWGELVPNAIAFTTVPIQQMSYCLPLILMVLLTNLGDFREINYPVCDRVP